MGFPAYLMCLPAAFHQVLTHMLLLTLRMASPSSAIKISINHFLLSA